jgi:hypothetical protein
MAVMASWQDYQRQAAAFFRSLGLEATTDERIPGARGAHAVDVAVRSQARAGIRQLWIVECKFWQRRVGKVHVAALSNIVQDVGADRGIMLSESGFQAGAIRLAAHSNITLTSLADLRENAEQEKMMVELAFFEGQIKGLADFRERELMDDALYLKFFPDRRPAFFARESEILLAIEGIRQARHDVWPVACPVISSYNGLESEIIQASNVRELHSAIRAFAQQLDRESRKFVAWKSSGRGVYDPSPYRRS